MTYTRTFAELSLAVQQEGAWENSADITPGVLLQAINYGLLTAYGIMVSKWEDYYTLTGDIPTTAGQSQYAIQNITQSGVIPDFYKLRHMDFSTDGVKFHRMYPMDLSQNHLYSSSPNSRFPKYQIRRTSVGPSASPILILVPPPVTGTIRMYYIPVPYQFNDVGDTSPYIFDVPAAELLVVHLAMRFCLRRSDLDLSGINQQIAEDTAGLRSAADNRDAGEPFSLDPAGPPRRWRCDEDEWSF